MLEAGQDMEQRKQAQGSCCKDSWDIIHSEHAHSSWFITATCSLSSFISQQKCVFYLRVVHMDCAKLFLGVSLYAQFFFTFLFSCDVSFHSAGNENNRLCSALLFWWSTTYNMCYLNYLYVVILCIIEYSHVPVHSPDWRFFTHTIKVICLCLLYVCFVHAFILISTFWLFD